LDLAVNFLVQTDEHRLIHVIHPGKIIRTRTVTQYEHRVAEIIF